MMMGLFHLLMVYLVAIYECFSDAGLKDTLMQKGIVPEGSILPILSRIATVMSFSIKSLMKQ